MLSRSAMSRPLLPITTCPHSALQGQLSTQWSERHSSICLVTHAKLHFVVHVANAWRQEDSAAVRHVTTVLGDTTTTTNHHTMPLYEFVDVGAV